MYQEHMVLKSDIESVLVNGVGTGFTVKMKIPYYRGVCLSLVEDMQIKYDNTLFTKDRLTFSVGEESYSFEEMATMTTIRWEFGEKATVFVPLKGGFALGNHRVEVTVAIRVSYMGGARPFTVVLEDVCPMEG